jgi:hypothetical protein
MGVLLPTGCFTLRSFFSSIQDLSGSPLYGEAYQEGVIN